MCVAYLLDINKTVLLKYVLRQLHKQLSGYVFTYKKPHNCRKVQQF